MKYPFYCQNNIPKQLADNLKKSLRNYFESLTNDKMTAETFARKGVSLIMGAVAAPGRATHNEVSVGSIPTPPTITSGTEKIKFNKLVP